jgi:hypothetical protein
MSLSTRPILTAPVKAYMRRHGSEMLAAEDPIAAIMEACACITADMAKNWFLHVGYL